MKTNVLILGIVACLATPVFSVQADGLKSKKKDAAQAQAAQTNSGMRTAGPARTAAVSHPNRETFYITNQVVTGSLIPVVVTRYRGQNTISSPLVTYDQTALDTTGSNDVGSELAARDPAITIVHR